MRSSDHLPMDCVAITIQPRISEHIPTPNKPRTLSVHMISVEILRKVNNGQLVARLLFRVSTAETFGFSAIQYQRSHIWRLVYQRQLGWGRLHVRRSFKGICGFVKVDKIWLCSQRLPNCLHRWRTNKDLDFRLQKRKPKTGGYMFNERQLEANRWKKTDLNSLNKWSWFHWAYPYTITDQSPRRRPN